MENHFQQTNKSEILTLKKEFQCQCTNRWSIISDETTFKQFDEMFRTCAICGEIN